VFGRSQRAYRIYFATDIHGSDRCFRKFLAAASVYEADALVLGGDIVGKAIVPITKLAGGNYRATLFSEERICSSDDLPELERTINFNGLYPWVAEEPDVVRLLEDPSFGKKVFDDIMVTQVEVWCDLAAQRLPDETICIITPGNDDPFVIDQPLKDAERVICPEGTVVELGPTLIASLGNTNRTPWATDREYDEPDLARQIEGMVAPAADGHPMVFNFHCPPFGSGLDTVAQLDTDFRPVTRHGQVVEIPVGSTAVRDAILKYQPVAGLHGHIHESQGIRRIGQTVCINPGSDYSAGVLKGVLLDLTSTGQYHDHLLTSG
jgi:uncharacterized protein